MIFTITQSYIKVERYKLEERGGGGVRININLIGD